MIPGEMVVAQGSIILNEGRKTTDVTVSNTESRIVDPVTGEDQGIGERGELWVRGPQVMTGYLNNDEATAATIDSDGWSRLEDDDLATRYEAIVDEVRSR